MDALDVPQAPDGAAFQQSSSLRRFIPKAHSISWWMLLVTTGAVLITSIDRAILPTVLPALLTDFHLDAMQGGFLVSLSFLGSTIGGVILGIFGDAMGGGPRRAWAWCLTVAVVIASSIATAFAKGLFLFKVLRVTMGIGTGGLEPINVAMISEWWPKEHRGFAVGTHHTGFPIGQFVGPLLIAGIVLFGTWREVFLLLPLLAVPIVVMQIILAKWQHLDSVNTWITDNNLTPSLTRDHKPAPYLKNPFPILYRVIRTDRNVALAVITNFLFLWTEAAVTGFLTLQLTREVHVSLAVAATISGASGITGWIGQVVWGTISDHRGRKFSLNIIAIGSAVSIFLMAYISSVPMAWLLLLGWGLFRNSPYPVLYAAVIDIVPGSAASGLGLMVGIGLGLSGVVAAPIGGWLIDHSGFTAHYTLLAALCLLALIPIAMMRESSAGVQAEAKLHTS